MEGVVVVTVLEFDETIGEVLALLVWDTADCRSLNVTITKSLVTEATVAVLVPVILVSALSVGGTVLSSDILLVCRLSTPSIRVALLCITSEADVIS